MRPRLVRVLLYSTYLAVAILVPLELLVRVSGYADGLIYEPIYAPFAGTSDIPYVVKPNLQNARGPGLSIVTTDSLGLRSSIAGRQHGPKAKGEYRIAFVGDSGTFGYGVPRTEDTYVAVVEQTLNSRQAGMKVRVFNYGVSAYNVKTMAATLRHRMLEIDPDLVVMVIIDDDFYLGRTPQVDAFGYLTGNRLPWLLPANSRASVYLRRSHLVHAVARIVGRRLDRERGTFLDPVLEGQLPDSYRYIREFRDIAEARGLPYLIVFRPGSEPLVTGRLVEHMRRERMKVVDLSYISGEFTRETYRASRFDLHPSAAVHRRIGEELAERILRERLQ